jgi:peptidoglycan hydrolase CwlO-like protein
MDDMSEDYALDLLRKRKSDGESIIQASLSEISRLNDEVDEQRSVIRKKTSQLDDLKKAIAKLELT